MLCSMYFYSNGIGGNLGNITFYKPELNRISHSLFKLQSTHAGNINLYGSTLPFFSSPRINPHKPIKTLQGPNFFRPFSGSKRNHVGLCSLGISHVKVVAPKLKAFAVSGLISGGDSEADAELEQKNLNKDAIIDLQLPRRNLLLKFTCNLCNERTSKLMNRLAYEKGLVYVQCAGCLKYHKLVDNLGLVVEYDFRGDMDLESNADEV